jgi:AraC-like DNA-binding protein
MSSGHLSRSFRAAFGATPYSYLMTRRRGDICAFRDPAGDMIRIMQDGG